MKILIVVPEIHRLGGVANHYLGLSPHWKCDVSYLFYGKRNDRMSKLVTLLLYQYDYLRFIFKVAFTGYDAVIINPSLRKAQVIRDGAFLLLARLFGKKVVTFIHGFDIPYSERLRSRGRLFRWTFNKSSFIYTLAGDFRDRLQEIGIICPILLTTTKVADELLDGVTVPVRDKVKTILFVARLVPEKGILIALEAFSKLKKSYPHLRFFVCGDGPALPDAKAFVADNGIKDVTFFGKVVGNDLRDKYLDSDLYILPTTAEGMATTVLEAMAFGLPVITRPVGGVVDFWEEGKMGCLLDSFDSGEYASAIKELIENPKMLSEISEFNHQYAINHFLASEVVDKFESDINRSNNLLTSRQN